MHAASPCREQWKLGYTYTATVSLQRFGSFQPLNEIHTICVPQQRKMQLQCCTLHLLTPSAFPVDSIRQHPRFPLAIQREDTQHLRYLQLQKVRGQDIMRLKYMERWNCLLAQCHVVPSSLGIKVPLCPSPLTVLANGSQFVYILDSIKREPMV